MAEPTVLTAEDAYRETARDAPPGARIPIAVRVTVEDPFVAYRRVRARSDDVSGVYLETTGGQQGHGYFGVDPEERIRVNPDAFSLDDGSATLDALQGILDGETLVRGDCDVPYPCGAIGWLSYDVARELESLPTQSTNDRGLPQLVLGKFETLASWTEPREDTVELTVTSCPRLTIDPDTVYRRGLEHALEFVEAATSGALPSVESPTAQTASFESDCSPEVFAERVRAVKQYIHDGDTFQANISQRLVAPAAVSPVAAYDALRRVNPAPYSALIELEPVDLVSASPELLVAVDGDRVVTEPIAGTRPRGNTPADDDELERDLLTDEKERAEHAMLVDLERNDLGKVCAYGSVHVSEYRRVDRYSEVMHLVSLVEGDRRPDVPLTNVVAAVFPGGTITGAPKPRTMEIIEELEATRRGPYTGSIGLFGYDDRATLNIVIRTLVRHRDEYHLRVGSGIVHDSVPEREYHETLDKARALVTAIDEALDASGTFAIAGVGEDG